MRPRSIQELANDSVIDNMMIEWHCIRVEDEPLVLLALPATKRYVWMHKHMWGVIRNHMNLRIEYFKTETAHCTKIDLVWAMHRDMKTLLRKMHKHYPVEFGYALKAPGDMHDMQLARRTALERLSMKIKGAV